MEKNFFFREKITPYIRQQIQICPKPDPLVKQFIYSKTEEDNEGLTEDPTAEENIKISHVVYQCYKERALLLVTNNCFAHCRFCTRKRIINNPSFKITKEHIWEGLDVIRNTPEIREIIISGGDPLVLNNEKLGDIFEKIKENKKIKIVRVDSRALTACPNRFTTTLINSFHKLDCKLWFLSHFNSILEISNETLTAVEMLLKAGIPVMNQSVFLAGINNSERDIIQLNRKLVEIGIKPYYIYLCDNTWGTKGFHCDLIQSLSILKSAFQHLSGLEIPFVVFVGNNGIKYRFSFNKNDDIEALIERVKSCATD